MNGRFGLLAVLLLCLSACASHPPASNKHFTVETLTYTAADAAEPQKAELYRPRGKTLRPAVVVVHGGGWIKGKRGQMEHIVEALVRHGYVVLDIDYRLAPEHPYPAAVDDVRSALRWLRDNAAQIGVDPQRLGLWGYSAGAHLAGLVAAKPRDDTPPVAAAVLGGMPADLTQAKESPLVQQFMGGKYDEMPDRYAQASPLLQLGTASAPMYLYHGSWDWIVRYEYSQQAHARLQELGVDTELCTLGGRGHFAAFLFDGRAMKGGMAFLDRYLKRTGEAR